LRGPIEEVLTARTGPLLWFGAIVGLWTAASFIETIRDILRRAYGVKYCAPVSGNIGWRRSILMILGAVMLLMIAFAADVVALSSAHHFVVEGAVREGLAHQLGSTAWSRRRPCSSPSTSCSWR
jgi:membrane protein